MQEVNPLSGGRKGRFRWLIWPAVIAVPLIALCLIVVMNTTAEALSPDEILAKKKWSDDELKIALARSMSPAMTGQRKKEVVKHLNAQLKRRSKEEQEKIRIGAVVASVGASLDQVRKMPDQERDKMINTIKKRADRDYAAIHSNPKKRKEFEAQLKTKEMEAFSKEVNRVIFSELSPAERVKFAPITKVWIKTMKSMGH